MSLGGRIRDLLRSNLGSLLDVGSDTTLDDYEEELPRVRSRLSQPGYTARRRGAAGPPGTAGPAADVRPYAQPPSRPDAERIRELHRILEVPVGADITVVKASYRRLLRQHHPDLVGPEAGSTERVQLLIQAYGELYHILVGS